MNINYRIYLAQNHNQMIPLVLLHGLMGYASNWGKVWPEFQNERSVLVLDQRGHGKSPKPPTGYTPADYALDLKELITLLKWNKIHLVGHSMGGRVAIHFADKYPENMGALILEDSGAMARPDRLDWIRNLLQAVPTPFPDRESAKRFFERHFQDDPLTGSFLHSNIIANESGLYDWRFLPSAMIETIATGRAQNAMDIFSRLDIPTLLIRGEKSSEFSSEEALQMRDCRAGIDLVVISNAGHFIHSTHPKEFSQAIKGFLSKAEGA